MHSYSFAIIILFMPIEFTLFNPMFPFFFFSFSPLLFFFFFWLAPTRVRLPRRRFQQLTAQKEEDHRPVYQDEGPMPGVSATTQYLTIEDMADPGAYMDIGASGPSDFYNVSERSKYIAGDAAAAAVLAAPPAVLAFKDEYICIEEMDNDTNVSQVRREDLEGDADYDVENLYF